MATFTNTNAIADGTTLTTGSSSAGGVAYDAASSSSAGGTMVGNSSFQLHGHNSVAINTSTTSASNLFGYNNTTLGTGNQLWAQGYFYFPSAPAANTNIMRFSTAGTTNGCATLILLTSGLLRFTDAAGATAITLSSSVPYAQWFRVQSTVLGGTSTGQVEIKLFSSPEDTTPTQTLASGATLNTNSAGGTTVDTIRMGNVNALAVAQTFYVGDVSVSNTGYPTPLGSPGWVISKRVSLG